ncbi:unnamed protein product [Spirodela intermedia]|uniref:Basic leucine-zipper C-terminal domain-containing protein n=1 Tax=Spirodela intermedia TaxID=51605 RepID=A0A7I8IWL2_SPIIN|nr:unnamed protein product [Spirodela intermedia]CAA6662369.1 unnamed protein product [Spirodela intermedia]
MDRAEGDLPNMKRSGSDWDLEAFLQPQTSTTTSPAGATSGSTMRDDLLLRAGGEDLSFNFSGSRDGDAINHDSAGDLINCLLWSQSHAPRHSSISATIESQSSVCVGSPTSSHKPKFTDIQAPGITSGSEQSDDESLDIEAGSCEQSADFILSSNRESAAENKLNSVDQLRGENASLYKQLMDASQQLTDAATDNRVLKSDVEALRVKVKMAEDLVTRGSLAFTLNNLLQSPAVAPQVPSAHHVCRASELPPPVGVQGDEGRYVGMGAFNGQLQPAGMETSEHGDSNQGSKSTQSQSMERIPGLEQLQSRIAGDISSCGSDMWPWASHVVPVSK